MSRRKDTCASCRFWTGVQSALPEEQVRQCRCPDSYVNGFLTCAHHHCDSYLARTDAPKEKE